MLLSGADSTRFSRYGHSYDILYIWIQIHVYLVIFCMWIQIHSCVYPTAGVDSTVKSHYVGENFRNFQPDLSGDVYRGLVTPAMAVII